MSPSGESGLGALVFLVFLLFLRLFVVVRRGPVLLELFGFVVEVAIVGFRSPVVEVLLVLLALVKCAGGVRRRSGGKW